MRKLFQVPPSDLGEGQVLFAWSPNGKYAAAAGNKSRVCIYDRNGKLYEELHLPVPEVQQADTKLCCCTQLEWDASGDMLAVLQAGSSVLLVWTAATRELQKLETQFRAQELTAVAWAPATGSVGTKRSSAIAVATAKGNLQLFSIRDKRTTPLVGKHTKKAVCMSWSAGNVLAIASQDKTLSLSDGTTGETLRVLKFAGDPVQMAVADVKDPATGATQPNQWSLITSKRVLYIFDGNSDAPPKELSFLETYGQVQHHAWYEGSCIMVAFRTGRVVVVSARSDNFGQEVQSDKFLDALSSMSHCPAAAQVAVGGGSTVKVISVGGQYGELTGSRLELAPGEQVQQTGWSADGQVLTVGTTNGQVHCFLASLPVVYSCHGHMLAQLTSLSEMSITDVNTTHCLKVSVACEPALCALGPAHLAVGINHQVLFYSHADPSQGMVSQREYMGGISQVFLNDTHAALLLDGRLLVHPIVPPPGQAADELDASLPPPGVRDPIACAALSQHFAVTGSSSGLLCYYLAQGLAPVNEYKHSSGILQVHPQPAGPRCVFEDGQHNTYLFSPVTDQLLGLPGYEGSLSGVLWDTQDPHSFLVTNGAHMALYKFLPMTVTGPRVLLVNKMPQPASHTPVAVTLGVVTCRLRSGALDMININSPSSRGGSDPGGPPVTHSKQALHNQFTAAVQTLRLHEAWRAATALRSPDAWRQLGLAALEVLDVDTGIAAFRQAGDASMVLSLSGLRWVTDRNLLSGHLLVLMERDYAHAQELFLRSSRPLAALEMRQDLKHWQQALALAQQLAPDRLPQLNKEHAGLLELVGDHAAAATHYQQALEALAGSPDAALQLACLSGLARTALLQGDMRTGRQLAAQVNSAPLFKECGGILEQLQQLPEAADMFLKAGMVEKAASIHIAAKNWAAAAPLMSQVASAKLQVQFAKAKEADGRWGEAATAYEAAGDIDNAVRLLTDRLNALGRAAGLVRKSRSKSAAAVLAPYCLAAGDDRGAVEFLLLAGQLDQAFDIAAARGQMEAFAELVGAGTSGAGEARRIAEYYLKRGELESAADMWSKAGEPGKAVTLFVQIGTPASIGKAISVLEAAAAASNPNLKDMQAQVLGAIQGLREGGALADELRLRLNMATGQLQAAARDAVQVARFEQEEGNYKLAHAKLFTTVSQLVGLGATPPQDLLRPLDLLHSYILVKSLVGMNNHEGAARMLARVAGSISRFPKHVVPILTSTVIECQRAGLKKSALEYAMTLMRPEYRNQVSEKYRKKIELMVRKPDRGDDPAEPLLACPFCQLPGPASQLQCVSCQNIIPLDIATGMRMYAADWCECPQCRFPGTGQGLMAVLAAEGACPMCGAAVAPAEVRQVTQPLQHWSCARLEAPGGRAAGPPAAVSGPWG